MLQTSHKSHYFSFIVFVVLLAIFSACSPKKITKRNIEYSDIYSKLSEQLSLKIERNDNLLLFQQAAFWLGTPYKMGGNTKQGIDCSGLAQAIYLKVFNVNIERNSSAMAASCVQLTKQQLEQGDLVFFSIAGKGIDHVGIFLKENKFLHSTTRKGVIISSLDEPYYLQYFVFGGRPKNRKL